MLNTGTWESILKGIRNYKQIKAFQRTLDHQHPQPPDVDIPKRRSIFYSDVTNSWCYEFGSSDRACVSDNIIII